MVHAVLEISLSWALILLIFRKTLRNKILFVVLSKAVLTSWFLWTHIYLRNSAEFCPKF